MAVSGRSIDIFAARVAADLARRVAAELQGDLSTGALEARYHAAFAHAASEGLSHEEAAIAALSAMLIEQLRLLVARMPQSVATAIGEMRAPHDARFPIGVGHGKEKPDGDACAGTGE
jgi:hypothetical protein